MADAERERLRNVFDTVLLRCYSLGITAWPQQVDRCLRAVLDVAQRWRPIKEAPKTPGVDVLVWWKSSARVAYYEDGHFWYPTCPGGWKIHPTLWMPLPAEPKQEESCVMSKNECETVATCTETVTTDVITERMLAAKDAKIKSLENQVERWRASNQEPHAEIKRLVK